MGTAAIIELDRGQIPVSSPQSPIDRLKILLNSSTPIVVMETVEEMRAVSLVRMACSELSLAVFEWNVARVSAREL